MANNYSFRATLINVIPNLRLWLIAAGMMMCLLPTLRSDAAQPKKSDKKPAENQIKKEPIASSTQTQTEAKTTMIRAGGMVISGIDQAHFEEIKQLISENKYKFLKTFDGARGEKQYVYSFTFADGSNTAMNFSMPLENVTSWEDYLQKRGEQQGQRQEKINQAIAAGQFRLINWEMIRVHLCRDLNSNQKFKVQRIDRHDGTVIAFPKAEFGKIPPGVQQTSWQEHLEAIRQKKRELLDMETTDYYTYELTADDGTKLIWNYGGGEPLKMPAQQ